MYPNTYSNRNMAGIEDFQMREDVINKLKHRFKTYGYHQIRTSTFEDYDMYSAITGTVNKDEMIKIVDSSGKVLVLRPDVTIPISRMTALNEPSNENILRYFYVLDIFRQSFDQNGKKENTQAGIECFGQSTPETDAEILMLAIHTLNDLGFSNFKIEIGHAGFIKELFDEACLEPAELKQLKTLIQSKNIAEMETFLATLQLKDELRAAILAIPLLYGDPFEVIKQAQYIVRNENMKRKLDNLIRVVNILKDYDKENAIVFNFGLINNMNYYSDLIFQGFTENIGKPVLMGGRYDHLGDQFSNPIPAIGFAFDVDSLIQVLDQRGMLLEQDSAIEFTIYYENGKQKDALFTAFKLREEGYQVLAFPLKASDPENLSSINVIYYEENQNLLISGSIKKHFSNITELTQLIQNDEVD